MENSSVVLLKPDGRLLIIEPKIFHVSKKDFEKTLKKADEVGLKIVERPDIVFSQSVVLAQT